MESEERENNSEIGERTQDELEKLELKYNANLSALADIQNQLNSMDTNVKVNNEEINNSLLISNEILKNSIQENMNNSKSFLELSIKNNIR